MPEIPLPYRLVAAAEQAIDRHHRAYLGEAADAVVAVLRELGAASAGYPEYITADELIALADELIAPADETKEATDA